jgi:hypothetical protein
LLGAARAAPLILVITLIRIKSFGSAPSGDAESDADQKRNCAAGATPGPGMMRQHQSGNQSQVEPRGAAQSSQDAPPRAAAGGENSGYSEHGRAQGIVQPPAPASRRIDSGDLPGQCDSGRDKKRGAGQGGQDEQFTGPGGVALPSFQDQLLHTPTIW